MDHGESTIYSCEFCGSAYSSVRELEQHIQGHINPTCFTCHKICSTWHNVEQHMVAKSGKKAFNCAICQRAFTFKAHVAHHIRATHLRLGTPEKYVREI